MLLALSSNQKLVMGLVAAAFVVFALLSSVVIPRSNPDFPERRLNLFIGVSVLFTVAMLLTIAFVAKETEEEPASAAETQVTEAQPAPKPEPAPAETTTATETAPAETESAAGGSTPVGKEIFVQQCGGCHTLADAGTTGSVGPNLDVASPSQDLVVERVTNGKGVMPPFEGTLSPEQIQEVAVYVSAAAGS